MLITENQKERANVGSRPDHTEMHCWLEASYCREANNKKMKSLPISLECYEYLPCVRSWDPAKISVDAKIRDPLSGDRPSRLSPLWKLTHQASNIMAIDNILNGDPFQGQRPLRNSVEHHAQLPSPCKRVVLKFGGTVCGRLPHEVANICLCALTKLHILRLAELPCRSALAESPIAVVCSARSGKTKIEGTTNLCAVPCPFPHDRLTLGGSLLKAYREACKPGSVEYKKIVSDILRQHVDGTVILSGTNIAAELVSNFKDQCSKLEAFLTTLSTGKGLGPEAEDRVLGVGEQLSARFLAALLQDKNTPAEYIDLSEIIKPEARSCSDESLYKSLSEAIGRIIEDCGHRVPVSPRFSPSERGD